MHAVTPLSQVDLIEIVGEDLFLGVIFLQFQSGEDLQNFTFDRYVIVFCNILYQLLGEGRTAEGISHADKHIHKSSGRAIPVHTVVLVEAMVLHCHHGVDQVLRNVLVVHPLAVFRTHQGLQFHQLSIFLIGNHRVFVEGIRRQIQCGLWDDDRLDIHRGIASHKRPGHDAQQQQSAQHFADAQGYGRPPGLRFLLPGTAVALSCVALTVRRFPRTVVLGPGCVVSTPGPALR